MRIFDDSKSGKVNFLDENSVLVGYDLDQSCCEHAGWHIGDKLSQDADLYDETAICHPLSEEMKEWIFDPTFFEETAHPSLDEGGMVIFRLIKGTEEKFLVLFNCHNGYYSHGFEMAKGEKVLKDGRL